MANVRFTLGALLSTVSTTANALTGTVATVGKSVLMLDAYVTNMADEQAKNIAADKEDFLDILINRKAREASDRDEEIHAYKTQSPRHSDAFQRNFNRYSKILRAEPTNTSPAEPITA